MFVCPECGQAQPAAGHCPADGTPVAAIGEDVLLGTTIGAYRVARLLGIGGMGRVYKGVHPAIGSRVAIKVLSRECSDRRDLVERFFAEAKAVNLIRHESIVNVLDLATLPDGRPYIIMEYLDGAPLASLIEHAVQHQLPLPLGGIARLVAEVLDALGAAHAKNIVHRDLKPDNVFVAPSGRPKILDFGIAKLSDVGNTSTRTGSLLGTPHYMSPEQAAGRPVDHRADLYAIGVILFECATGSKPFQAEALFDLLRMHVEAPPPSPRALRPDMPPELEHVILTALAKPADQRFASAMAMSMALQQATAQLPPEQWRPLTPMAARPSGGGWAPTPPSSWSAGGATPHPTPHPPTPHPPTPHPPTPHPATPHPATPHPQAHPPAGRPQQAPLTPQQIGNLSTVSSGQVTPGGRPAPRSRRGLWIAAAAVVMIGGGVTAGALLGRHSNGADPNGSSAGPAVAAGEPAPAAANDPWAARPKNDQAKDDRADKADKIGKAERDGADDGKPDKPEEPDKPDKQDKQDRPDRRDKPDRDDDDDEAPSAAAAGIPAGDPVGDALKQVDDMIKRLPPDQQKRLAAYRGLSKLPPAERLKRLRKLAQQGMTDAADAAAIAAAAAAMGGDDDAPAPPPPPVPAAPGRWITNESIDPPGGYHPERVDVTAFIPWAIAQAKKAIPDAQLFRIDVDGVGPDGRANLTLPTLASKSGSIDLRFVSPSHNQRDPRQPVGVGRHDFKCEFRVMATPEGVELMPIDFFDCAKEHVVPVPRCSLAGVWKKAILRKAPAQNAVGNIGYRSNGGKPLWYFDIGFGTDVSFSTTFGDDC